MTEKDREMRDRDAARRLLGQLVTAMVRCRGRNGPRAVSAKTFTAIGTTGRERTRAPRNRPRQHVRIHYAAGEVATLAWADGTRELVPVPRQRRDRILRQNAAEVEGRPLPQ